MTSPVVGIDLGGTKIFGALVDPTGRGVDEAVLRQGKVPTPTTGVDDVVDELVGLIHRLDEAPSVVGIGTPGAVEPGTGRVLFAPNLRGFEQPVPLAGRVAERLGCPVVAANDVNLATLGEARAGAAAGEADVLAVWMGTGLGGGLILDGRLRLGPTGLAGELGHVVVVPGGRRCACGGLGHLEAYIGRRTLEEVARSRHAAGEPTALVELAGDRPMKSKVFRAAYDDGDELARELVDQGLEMVGIAVANVIALLDVRTVLIGGGMGDRFGPLAVERLSASLAELAFAGPPPRVVMAQLGDVAGALGAAMLASAHLDGTDDV